MVFGILGFLPAGSFPAGVFGWGWTPTACRQGMPPARRGFVRGQENDRPDAALGFDREPAARGLLPRAFHVFLEHLLFRSLVDVWGWPSPQNGRGWPRGGLYGPWERFEVSIYPERLKGRLRAFWSDPGAGLAPGGVVVERMAPGFGRRGQWTGAGPGSLLVKGDHYLRLNGEDSGSARTGRVAASAVGADRLACRVSSLFLGHVRASQPRSSSLRISSSAALLQKPGTSVYSSASPLQAWGVVGIGHAGDGLGRQVPAGAVQHVPQLPGVDE